MNKPLTGPLVAPRSIPVPLGIGIGGPAPPPDPWINNGTYLDWPGGIEVGGALDAQNLTVSGTPVLLTSGGTITGSLTVTGPTTFQSPIAFNASTIDCGTY